MNKRFYTPKQLRDLLFVRGTGDVDAYDSGCIYQSEHEHLAQQMLDQGTLHRSVFVEFGFEDAEGEHHEMGLYGTDDCIPHFGVIGFPVKTLFGLNGDEILLKRSIDVTTEGFNATSYSVDMYLESYFNQFGKPLQSTVIYEASTMASNKNDSPKPVDLALHEQLAELLNIAGQSTVSDAIQEVKSIKEGYDQLIQFRNRSPMFNDIYELLAMADKGQFKGMVQGTPENAKDQETVIGLINSTHDTLNVNDSYSTAKMITQLSK